MVILAHQKQQMSKLKLTPTENPQIISRPGLLLQAKLNRNLHQTPPTPPSQYLFYRHILYLLHTRSQLPNTKRTITYKLGMRKQHRYYRFIDITV